MEMERGLSSVAYSEMLCFVLKCHGYFPARKETAREKLLKEEQKILESVAEKKALMGVAELALGIEYEDPIKTGYDQKPYTKFLSRIDT